MADVTKSQTLEQFMGINNVDDAVRLVPIVVSNKYVYPLQAASNVDIDNTFGIASRSGYGTSGVAGTDIHSLWSDNITCLFVDGGTLKELGAGYTTVILRSSLKTGARMSYAVFNDRIYYTNGYQIGYVKANVSHELTDPLKEFKLPLPAGQLIEYYRGCLYVAKENVLYISDPLCDYFDVRTGYKLFSEDIVLLRAVDDGLYIGDKKIWWVKGDAAEAFERIDVYSHRAVPYTDVLINGQDIGAGVKGNVAIWTSDNGICIGDNSGSVVNLTEGRYAFTAPGQGAGFVRETNNIRHYINSLF